MFDWVLNAPDAFYTNKILFSNVFFLFVKHWHPAIWKTYGMVMFEKRNFESELF